MPGMDGLEATRRIVDDPDLRDVRVIMLTTFDLDEHVFEALGAGASGFLVKDTEPVELLRGVRLVAAGEALLSPGVTRRLIAEFASQRPRSGPAPAELEQLTDREREVVGLVALGPVQRGDRRDAGDQPRDREDPREPGDAEGRRARPRPARRPRVPVRARRTATGVGASVARGATTNRRGAPTVMACLSSVSASRCCWSTSRRRSRCSARPPHRCCWR